MEEILASIRRIISEDDAPAAEESPAIAAPEPEPAPPVAAAPEPEPVADAWETPDEVDEEIELEEEEEILELTDRVEPEETHGDLDVYSPPPPPPEPVAAAPAAPYTPPAGESLVSAPAATAAASAFGQLSAAISMPRDGRTLEDVVRELLNPLLAAWLDQHLPAIVQAKVEEEVERIARGRVR